MKPTIAQVDVENLLPFMDNLMGYTVRVWGKHDSREAVIRITEYVLGLSPGGLHSLLKDMVNDWGIPQIRATAMITHALFPLDGSLKPLANKLAETPSVAKIWINNTTLLIEIQPLSPGVPYEQNAGPNPSLSDG